MDEKTNVTRTGEEKRAGSYEAGMPPAGGKEEEGAEKVMADIERTRAEMSETVDAIQRKLSPDRLKGQMKDKVREATIGRVKGMTGRAGSRAKGIGSDIVEAVKSNPVPAAMVGVGLGWIMMKRRSAHGNGNGSGAAYGVGERAEEMSGRARAKAGEVSGAARQKAGQISEQVRGKAEEISGMARERAQQTRGRLQDMLQDNPLALGAAVLALGALVGLIIPETRKEEELMGETRDTLMSKARDVAQEAMQKVQRVAESARQSAEQEAEKQGVGR